MSILFEKDSKFNSLNLTIQGIASIPTTKSTGMDENYHNITPKPTIESTRMDGSYQNSAPRPTTSKGPHEEFLSQLAKRLKGLISVCKPYVRFPTYLNYNCKIFYFLIFEDPDY